MADELEMRISELPATGDFNIDSLLECAVRDFSTETGYNSSKITILQLANKILTQVFQADLETESKYIIGAINEANSKGIPTTEDLSSQLVWNDSLVESSGRGCKVLRNGKIVTVSCEFILKARLTDLGEIIRGFPLPYSTYQFTGFNVKGGNPVAMAIQQPSGQNYARLCRFYGGATAAGDNMRLGFTYICK